MNYASKELTAALQKLTTKEQSQTPPEQQKLPTSLPAAEFKSSRQVELFLDRSFQYSAKTRNVHVGTY
jgi:hypothetical protein